VNLQPTPRLARRVRRLQSREREAVRRALRRLQLNPADPALRLHKLGGRLSGRWAFSAGYDLRIVYRIDGVTALLLDVGTHDEVY
jgi:mRNA-degrading endonuclease YafQ of YafQ-DinJ toxin-antitoxin module